MCETFEVASYPLLELPPNQVEALYIPYRTSTLPNTGETGKFFF